MKNLTERRFDAAREALEENDVSDAESSISAAIGLMTTARVLLRAASRMPVAPPRNRAHAVSEALAALERELLAVREGRVLSTENRLRNGDAVLPALETLEAIEAERIASLREALRSKTTAIAPDPEWYAAGA